MKVLVIGASAGAGLAAVEQLLAEGHEVTAFARRADRIAIHSSRLHTVNGDATRAADIDAAVANHDAVMITVGIQENPLRVRLLGPARTPLDVRSIATRNAIAAMRKHGVRRLVALTSYGVGATRDRLRLLDKLFFSLVLKPQIADTELQNTAVEQSGLDWILVQPVHLTDAPSDAMPFASTAGETAQTSVSRRSVARFLASAVQGTRYIGKSVALSGPVPALA